MPIEILMPALSPTMTEGNVTKWLKKEGDEVHSGDVLAEIETDKATMEFEAVDDGRLGKILVPEGAQGIKVNQPIAVLLGEGEDAAAIEAAPAAPPTSPAAAPQPVSSQPPQAQPAAALGVPAAPTPWPALSKERVAALAGNPPYTEVPLTAMRRVIARRLSESKQTIPHFYLTVDCELDELMRIRAELNAKSD